MFIAIDNFRMDKGNGKTNQNFVNVPVDYIGKVKVPIVTKQSILLQGRAMLY